MCQPGLGRRQLHGILIHISAEYSGNRQLLESGPSLLEAWRTILNVVQYTVLFDSASEVYSLITPHDGEQPISRRFLHIEPRTVRRALLDAPENIATLIRVITARLTNLISDHTFPTPTITAANAIAFMKAGNGDRNTTKEVLNCLRVLQRVLPVVFEVEGESSVFELQVLWRREEVYEPEDLDSRPPQFVIEDEDASDEESAPKPAPKPRPKSTKPALGEKLFGSIVDLLFCCGFTLPTKIQVDHHKINYIIWCAIVFQLLDAFNHSTGRKESVLLRILVLMLSMTITKRRCFAFFSSYYQDRYTCRHRPSFPSLRFTLYTSYRRYLDAMS